MTIETKFNLYDEAYIIYGNKPSKVKITEILYSIDKCGVLERYGVNEEKCYYLANEIFATKEELLNYISYML